MILVRPSHEILTDIDGDAILRRIEAAGRTCYKSEGVMVRINKRLKGLGVAGEEVDHLTDLR